MSKLNTVFMSKYPEFELTLKSADREIVNTNQGKKVINHPEISAKFKNMGIYGYFDAADCDIPWDTERIVKELRQQDTFGTMFYQPDKPPVTAGTLVKKTVRELKGDGDLEEVTKPSVVIEALELEENKENRNSVKKILRSYLQNTLGVKYEKSAKLWNG